MNQALRAHRELVLVFVIGAVAQLELWFDPAWAPAREELSLVALAMAAALLLRLRAPVLTVAIEAAGLELMGRLNTASENNDPMAMVVIALVAIYSAGAHARGRWLVVAAVAAVAMTVLFMVEDGQSMNVSGFLFFGFFVFAPFLGGVVIRTRRDREHVLVADRDERARVAVAEERARIARELHDVVSHAIGVTVLQARGARHALETDPAAAREAIDAIESTSQSALAEMRRLLGVLRQTDDDMGLAPQPSVEQLPALVAQVTDAGLPVELAVEGSPVALAPGVDLSAYRIVQEALTNALKHAGPARACVTLRYEPGALVVEVTDDGRAGASNGTGGHGLVGMRERVAVFGGELTSGPADEGGYAVRARLPL